MTHKTRLTPGRSRRAQLGPMLMLVTLAACGEAPTTPPQMEAAFGKPGGGGTVDVPVNSALLGTGTIRAVGGVYSNGTNGVSTLIQSVGDWVLDQTARNATRTTSLNLTQTVGGLDVGTAPFGTAEVQVRFISKATDRGLKYQTMTLDQQYEVPLSLAFSYGGKDYGLRMNTANHSSTTYARVTCTAGGVNTCTAWRLTPSGENGSIARLEQVTNKGMTLIGFRYMTFDIEVTKQ